MNTYRLDMLDVVLCINTHAVTADDVLLISSSVILTGTVLEKYIWG